MNKPRRDSDKGRPGLPPEEARDAPPDRPGVVPEPEPDGAEWTSQDARDIQENELRRELEDLVADINDIDELIDGSDWESKPDYEHPIDSVRLQAQEIREQIEELSASGPEGWRERQADIRRALNELSVAVEGLSQFIDDYLPD